MSHKAARDLSLAKNISNFKSKLQMIIFKNTTNNLGDQKQAQAGMAQ